MEQTFQPALVAGQAGQSRASSLRRSEWVLLAYFGNTAALALWRGIPLHLQLAAVAMPLVVWWLAGTETKFSKPWTSVLRDWLPLGLLLVGYLQANWFSGPALDSWQRAWIEMDRTILGRWGLHAAVESAGAGPASLLEGAYLLMYAVPALCLGAVHFHGRRGRVDRFLQVFLLGTLSAYALLPHFPSIPPRLAFPGTDLPGVTVWLRTVNLWVLGHFDITTSVFPSGHVAAAFAAAFGLWRAIPERRWLAALGFVQAALVALATIYGRYHYAMDAVAGAAVSAVAFVAVEALLSDG